MKQPYKVSGQSAAFSIQTSSFPGDAEVLTGSSSDNKVNCSTVLPSVNFCHVAQVGHVWIMVCENGTGESLYLRKGNSPPSKRLPRHACRLDTGTDRKIVHNPLLSRVMRMRGPRLVGEVRREKYQDVRGRMSDFHHPFPDSFFLIFPIIRDTEKNELFEHDVK